MDSKWASSEIPSSKASMPVIDESKARMVFMAGDMDEVMEAGAGVEIILKLKCWQLRWQCLVR